MTQKEDYRTPCGAPGYPDFSGEFPVTRCMDCLMIVGSLGMPRHCRETMERQDALERLKGNLR